MLVLKGSLPIKCPSVCATEDQLITGSTPKNQSCYSFCMKHVSFVFQVMSAKFLPRLDLLSIMPLTVQKVLIQNIVEVIKGALHLNIQLFDQF